MLKNINKIIAFQKMMYQVSFVSYFSTAQRRSKIFRFKNEQVILTAFTAISFLTGISLLNDFAGIMMMFIAFTMPSLFLTAADKENIIFCLPLKNGFIFVNFIIFIFSTIIFLTVVICGPIIISSQTQVFSGHPGYDASVINKALLQDIIILILFADTFLDSIVAGIFIKKKILRLSFMSAVTAVYCSIPIYLFCVPPAGIKNFSMLNSILRIPLNWQYLFIAFLLSLAVISADITVVVNSGKMKRNRKIRLSGRKQND